MQLASANINHLFKCLANGRLRFLGFLFGVVGNRHERDATKILNSRIETRDAKFDH